jgi:hypothetical protein
VVEIRYWDKGAWISYLKDDILPFYESLLAMLNLWKELKEAVHGEIPFRCHKGRAQSGASVRCWHITTGQV